MTDKQQVAPQGVGPLPLGFAGHLYKSLRWCFPLWMIFTFMPLLFGNMETFAERLLVGTPAALVLLVVYEALRTGIRHFIVFLHGGEE